MRPKCLKAPLAYRLNRCIQASALPVAHSPEAVTCVSDSAYKKVVDVQKRLPSDLMHGRACLSNVKVVFWHVSERLNLQVFVIECKLVA